jgi:hypothetical protein
MTINQGNEEALRDKALSSDTGCLGFGPRGPRRRLRSRNPDILDDVNLAIGGFHRIDILAFRSFSLPTLLLLCTVLLPLFRQPKYLGSQFVSQPTDFLFLPISSAFRDFGRWFGGLRASSKAFFST